MNGGGWEEMEEGEGGTREDPDQWAGMGELEDQVGDGEVGEEGGEG